MPHRHMSAGMAGAASPSMRLWLSRMSLRGRFAGGGAEPSSSAARRPLMPADEAARADVAWEAANCSAYSSDWPATEEATSNTRIQSRANLACNATLRVWRAHAPAAVDPNRSASDSDMYPASPALVFTRDMGCKRRHTARKRECMVKRCHGRCCAALS